MMALNLKENNHTLVTSEYRLTSVTKETAMRQVLRNLRNESVSETRSFYPKTVNDERIIITDRHCNMEVLSDDTVLTPVIPPLEPENLHNYKVRVISIPTEFPQEMSNIELVNNVFDIEAYYEADAIRICLNELLSDSNEYSFIPVAINGKRIYILDRQCNITYLD